MSFCHCSGRKVEPSSSLLPHAIHSLDSFDSLPDSRPTVAMEQGGEAYKWREVRRENVEDNERRELGRMCMWLQVFIIIMSPQKLAWPSCHNELCIRPPRQRIFLRVFIWLNLEGADVVRSYFFYRRTRNTTQDGITIETMITSQPGQPGRSNGIAMCLFHCALSSRQNRLFSASLFRRRCCLVIIRVKYIDLKARGFCNYTSSCFALLHLYHHQFPVFPFNRRTMEIFTF